MTAITEHSLILASSSTARKRMLRDAGLDFVAASTGLDEAPLKRQALQSGANGPSLAATLAEAKARSAALHYPDKFIIGGDQVLVCEGRMFDKAADMAEARSALQRLSGRRHELHAAVCIVSRDNVVWRHVSTARLWMRPLNGSSIDRYLDRAGAEVLWSVGCYHIEGLGAQLFERIEGDHFTIQGLPLLPLLAFLRDEGILPT